METAVKAFPGTSLVPRGSHSSSCCSCSSTAMTLRRPLKPSTWTNKHINANRIARKSDDKIEKKKKRKEKRENGEVSDVLRLMDALGISTPPEMYSSFVRECIVSKDTEEADALHEHITRTSLEEKPVTLLNRLLLLHVSLDRVSIARELFDEMPAKDFKSWAVMVVAYVNAANYDEALSLLVKMLSCEGVGIYEFPAWMMTCLVKICTNVSGDSGLDLGKQIHGSCLKLGLADGPTLGTCLMSFYERFECPESAGLIFDRMARRGSAAWMARLSRDSRERRFLGVLDGFKELGEAGAKKNASVLSVVLRACARIGDGGRSGRQVHGNVAKLGLESDPCVQCGLVDMYAKNGLLEDAKTAFETRRRGRRRNNACWNAMLCGYVRSELYVEAIKLVYEMKTFRVRVQQSLLDELGIACARGSLKELYSGALVEKERDLLTV